MAEQKPTETKPASDQVGSTQVVKTQADIALERDQKAVRDKLAKDDERRAQEPKVTMVCVSPFTIVDNPAEPAGRVVQAGEELRVAESDVQAYTGRCRLKADEGAPDRVQGPQVSRG